MGSKTYWEEKINILKDNIKKLNDKIENYQSTINMLKDLNINTMKKPILFTDDKLILEKWNNKNKAIRQRNKRIGVLSKRILKYEKYLKEINKDIITYSNI